MINRLLQAFLTVALLSGCGASVTELPNGYIMMKTESLPNDKFAITDGGGILMIAYNVYQLGVRSNMVFGKVVKAPPPPGFEAEAGSWSEPGYFLLNTRNGDKWVGLEESAWRGLLRSQGLPSEPKLLDSQSFMRASPRSKNASPWSRPIKSTTSVE